MAQAVFEEHPLQEYLRDNGESPYLVPGISGEFLSELDDGRALLEDEDVVEIAAEDLYPTWLPAVLRILQSLSSARSIFSSKQSSAFVERFKYDVISSSLLSTSLQPQTHSRRSSSPFPPGKLGESPVRLQFSEHRSPQPPAVRFEQYRYLVLPYGVALLALFFSGYYFFGGIWLLISLINLYIYTPDSTSRHYDTTPTLGALNDLIAAGNVWDSVVQEVFVNIQTDEQSSPLGSSTPTSSSQTLRVALHSSLHTTQTQCDNIRHLVAALTSPSEVNQISEMYAPPSRFSANSQFPPSSPPLGMRPMSLPTEQYHREHMYTTSIDTKRQTWNGSYATLASAGSPTTNALKRREKRRSDLSAILGSSSTENLKNVGSSTPPVLTPDRGTPLLDGVAEEDSDCSGVHINDQGERVVDLDASLNSPTDSFFSSALDLRRRRRSQGLQVIGLTPDRTLATGAQGHLSVDTRRSSQAFSRSRMYPLTPPSNTSARSGSKFTSRQPPRHPLALSSINQALEGALAAKRYTCSHLLSLRFSEEEGDEPYWENVRSVMALLTTALGDVSARLTEALEAAEYQKAKDQNPTPPQSRIVSQEIPKSKTHSPWSSISLGFGSTPSFAPMPSHLARFASHVDAISTALNDARDELEQTVSALKSDTTTEDKRSSVCSEPEDHPALQAYERLRRELGLALRECERGRERLLDLVKPLQSDNSVELDDLPALGHYTSDDSDKLDAEEHEDISSTEHHGNISIVTGDDAVMSLDDVTAHLLAQDFTLPPLGAETVYEAEIPAEGVLFTRERSKLSREERIQLAKQAREAKVQQKPARESWGPGGEVVQELKDVIWQVGEKRRKMVVSMAGRHRTVVSPTEPPQETTPSSAAEPGFTPEAPEANPVTVALERPAEDVAEVATDSTSIPAPAMSVKASEPDR